MTKKISFLEKVSIVIFLISRFYKNVWDLRTEDLLDKERTWEGSQKSIFDEVCDEGDRECR